MKRYIKKVLKKIASKHRFLTSVYYLLIDRKFSDEMDQVLNGNSEFSYTSDYFLRREIHRLEKSLCYPEKKYRYGVDLVGNILNNWGYAKPKTALWGLDVISKYLDLNKNKSWISDVRTDVITPCDEPTLIPFEYAIVNSVQYSAFVDQLESRRSVRWYSSKPINGQSFEHAVSASLNAPSACNRLPYKFYAVLNSQDRASDIAKCAAGTSGYADQISNILIVVGDLSAYENEKDRHAMYIDASLAVMNLIHLLQIQGIGSCCINWSEDKTREANIRKLVSLPRYEKIIMLMSFGYPSKSSFVPRSVKKDTKDILHYVD